MCTMKKSFIITAIQITLCILLAGPVSASEMSFDQALQKMHKTNKALSAAKMEKMQLKYKRKAAWGLFLPRVGLQARHTEINDKITIDLNEIRDAMLFLHSDNPMAGMLPSFETQVQDKTFINFNATATLPLFTGGRIVAANRAAQARLEESQAKYRQVESALVSELVSRYFSLRLAREVVDVRKQVLEGMDQHLFEANKMEESGMIAKAERLHAQVFHSEAEREYKKALRNRDIALTALNNTLSNKDKVDPISPLFIVDDIEPLNRFQQAAINKNPLLNQISTKRELAKQGYNNEFATFMPEVYLFGKKELYTDDLTILEPQWAFGIGLNYNLFEGFSNYNRLQAAKYVKRQVTDFNLKAKQDIRTLVEKRYNELLNAREQYESSKAAIQFTEEYVRVRTRAFEEGMGTSIDVVDAQLALSRVKIDRLIALYNFDNSLAELLEASGQSDRFETYRNQSNVEVEIENQ